MADGAKSIDQYSCRYFIGIGPKNAQKLEKLGIRTAQDVLFHLPLRYEDRTKLVTVMQSSVMKTAVLDLTIQSSQIIRRPKPQLLCRAVDSSGMISLRFIHYTNFQRDKLKVGVRVFVVGEVRTTHQGLEIIHPEYQILSVEENPPLSDTLTPIYPTTEGVSQKLWLKLTEQALKLLKQRNVLEELLPKNILAQYQLPSLTAALSYIHRPPINAELQVLSRGEHASQQRLIIEELLAHRLALLKLRKRQQSHQAHAMSLKKNILKQLTSRLEFELTFAQKRVLSEIERDLEKPYPMMRLVQGDVGSGKTIVAALAALHVIGNHQQVAMMAPTEILAEQHYRVFYHWLQPLGIHVVLLKSALSSAKRREVLAEIEQGSAALIVGTHALFQKEVQFQSLGLIIVDEQHRFGVHQRLSLKEKGLQGESYPHQLIMTATPIPRTLAMNFYADLDCSTIDELPKGRKPVKTLALSNEKRAAVTARINAICEAGQQVYWVCPLIEESEVLQCQAAEVNFELLSEQLSSLSVGLVHGRMKPKEKDAVMQAFKAGVLNVLVATTVIEVGVDVPNASLMVIENAERMGLAQLHQLRGRVGRGALESYCVLLYQAPLRGVAKERIEIMRCSNNGFEIAEKDLEIRGPGEVLGTRQTGAVSFRIADIVRDQHLLPKVQVLAEVLWNQSSAMSDQLVLRWLGEKEQFAAV